MTSWYPEHSANVASSSSVMALYFSCSWASSSSSLSTSFWSFWTDLSANSALASACFSLAVRDLICSLQLASLWLAFSSETSRDFKLLATTLNSSSSSIIFISPVSALSSQAQIQLVAASSEPLHTSCLLLQPGFWLTSTLPQACSFFPHPGQLCSPRPFSFCQSHQQQ